jgi:hypothetical protein
VIWTTCQPVKSELAVGFPAQGVRHNSQGSHEKACSCCDEVSSCYEQSHLGEEVLGPRISKGEVTNGVTNIANTLRGSDTKVCHTMDQGAQTKRWIKRMKPAIGFKDDGTINGHKVIK